MDILAYDECMEDINIQPEILVLAAGEDLFEKLITFVNQYKLNGAWLQGLGSSRSATLGFYSPETKEYQWQTYTEPLEIVSLQGNLAWVDDEPFWHVHGTFSGPDYASVSGHVKSLTVGLTLEVLITPLSARFTRTHDENTGLNLLARA